MCGILAAVGTRPAPEALERALGVMAHRGPEEHNSWSDATAWLGHRRLRIIDLSANASQPMANEDGTVRVVFNGEIYNFEELRKELESKGHRFRSRSDTEVIVHAYEEWGDQCITRFWGMFAFCIWDGQRQRLLVARDRFGKKPVNYLCKNNLLVVASEIPAILATSCSSRQASVDGLALFWQLNFIPAPYSAFSDIQKLPAGHAMAYEGGRLRIWRYYPPEQVATFSGTYEDAKAEAKTLLADAVRRRLVSDVPLGITLSGGIDSALVAMAARELNPGRLITLTVRPHLKGNRHDEGEFARITARLLETEHYEIEPQPIILDSIGSVIRNLGEPFAIASAIPAFYLFQALKKQVTVVLSGDGGDELFAGYTHYRSIRWQHLLRKFGAGWTALDQIGNGAYGLAPGLRPLLKTGLALMQFASGLPPSEARWESDRALRPAYRERLRNNALFLEQTRQIEALFGERNPVKLASLVDQFYNMTYHILTKVDITSMAHSVEVRTPILDHRLAEIGRSLPLGFLIEGKTGKRLLRDLLKGRWPEAHITRPKTGFGLPIREVFANEASGYLLETLMAPHPAYDELVCRNELPRIMAAHKAGRPYQTGLLLKLLVVRLWMQETNCSLN